METRPIKQRERCLPVVLYESKGLCLSPLMSHREGSEKGSNRHGHIYPNNSSFVPKIITIVIITIFKIKVNKF